jgi:hypothetical protein
LTIKTPIVLDGIVSWIIEESEIRPVSPFIVDIGSFDMRLRLTVAAALTLATFAGSPAAASYTPPGFPPAPDGFRYIHLARNGIWTLIQNELFKTAFMTPTGFPPPPPGYRYINLTRIGHWTLIKNEDFKDAFKNPSSGQ